MTITTEIHRQVWDDAHGICIVIGPDADGLDFVRVRTFDSKAEEWWGKIDVCFDPEFALQFAKALEKAALEAKKAG